jgi:hypothetical protein
MSSAITVKEARELFRSGVGKGMTDISHVELVRGVLRLECPIKLQFTPILRYAGLMFSESPGSELRVLTDPNKDSLLETLASDFEVALNTKSVVKVITVNGKYSELERFKQQYAPRLQVAYGVTTNNRVPSEVITENCCLEINPELTGEIRFDGHDAKWKKELFESKWLKLTDPEEYARREERDRKKYETGLAAKVLRYFFR